MRTPADYFHICDISNVKNAKLLTITLVQYQQRTFYLLILCTHK